MAQCIAPVPISNTWRSLSQTRNFSKTGREFVKGGHSDTRFLRGGQPIAIGVRTFAVDVVGIGQLRGPSAIACTPLTLTWKYTIGS